MALGLIKIMPSLNNHNIFKPLAKDIESEIKGDAVAYFYKDNYQFQKQEIKE